MKEMRVPLILYPRVATAAALGGGRNVDIVPTILKILRVPVPKGVEGKPLVALP